MAGQLYQLYRCPGCQRILRRPHSADPAPSCCSLQAKWLRTMTIDFPRPVQFGKAPGIDFRNTNPIDVPIGAGGMRFESVAELRKFEKASEQAAANGEGQQYTVRGYSRDRSNMHEHTMDAHPDELLRPDLSRTHADGTPRVQVQGAVRPIEDDPDIMGPGADPNAASALDSL